VPFEATWIGDGPELPAMAKRIAASPIAGTVRLHGFEDNRDVLLSAMRKSDIFLFCHKTAESPRCLIEALVSGCPLIGYKTAYPQGLVDRRGGGIFVGRDDVGALADCVAQLHRDRPALARLVADAAASGELYNEAAVYEHRALLMKRPPTTAS
jgi:glycosyltransferase involved in cell wall biosynthesis